MILEGRVFAPDEGGGGTGSASGGEKGGYLSQLSPDLRSDERVVAFAEKHPKLNDLMTAAVDMDGRLGRSILVPDAGKPDPAEVKAFREKLGIPDDYTLKADGFKTVPGIDGLAAMVKERAKELTLTSVQAQKLFDALATMAKAGGEGSAKARKEAEDALPAKILQAMGGKEEGKTAVVTLFTRFLTDRIGDPEMAKRLKASGLLDDPAFVMKMAQFEDFFSEEPFFKGSSRAPAGQPAPRGTFGGSYAPDFAAKYGGRK